MGKDWMSISRKTLGISICGGLFRFKQFEEEEAFGAAAIEQEEEEGGFLISDSIFLKNYITHYFYSSTFNYIKRESQGSNGYGGRV